MAKGGYRPGAGRPKGSGKKIKEQKLANGGPVKKSALPMLGEIPGHAVYPPPAVESIALPAGHVEPLVYMLNVINDPEADAERRDRMAIAAAPFRHPRLEKATMSKKDDAANAAKDAAVGNFATPSAPKLVVNNK